MIRFACPGCSATFTVGDEKAGKTGKCPKCQSQFVIPAADAAAPTADAPPPIPAPSKPSTHSTAPLPPPPAADPNAPVEIQPCPKCGTRLSVLPTDVGVEIQCPSCETVFRATRADAPPPPDTGSKKGSSSLVKLGSGSDRDDDDDDRGSKRKSRRGDDDDDDDRGSKRKSRRGDDDDDDDRGSKRKSRRGDDDDDDDRPSRRRRRSRRDDDDGYQKPDQSQLVMIFTIIGAILCWNIIGIGMNIASLVIANINISEIDAGRMVGTNRGQMATCRTVNIVCLCLPIVAAICWCGFVVIVGAAGASR